MNDIKLPPLGVVPKFISDLRRLNELNLAIARYYDAGLVINIEWVEERNALIREEKKNEKHICYPE